MGEPDDRSALAASLTVLQLVSVSHIVARREIMGVGCFPAFDRDVPNGDYEGDGKGLVSETDTLEKIALENGLEPLTMMVWADPGEFLDEEEIAALEAEMGDIGGEEPWFEAEKGLQTVRGLLVAIRDKPEYRNLLQEPDDTLEELTELERCLELGRLANARFRLQLW
jgi:hypothetical protein